MNTVSSDDALPEDQFLHGFLGAVALDYALRHGIIDGLARGETIPDGSMSQALIAMLCDAGVLDGDRLSSGFLKVFGSRFDILEQKLKFIMVAARDVTLHFDALIEDLPRFMHHSETFALFRYDKAFGTDPTSLAETKNWVDYVTALSRAEAPHLAPHMPLEGVACLLEIGGNTGVMARAILDQFPEMRAGILDLPAVCALAEQQGEYNERLQFFAGDARKLAWPKVADKVADAILYKSVLHDWPDEDARKMIARAVAYLPSGGRIVICERGQFSGGPMPFSMTANIVFAPFYRDPSWYEKALAEAGLVDISCKTIPIDMPFHIVSGQLK